MAITNGYASLAELKTLLGFAGTAHDADLERAIESASRQLDDWTGRRFYADGSATANYYTAEYADTLLVDDISTTTALVVKTTTTAGTWGQTWTINDWTGSYGFTVEPEDAPYQRLHALSGSWPDGYRAVEVTATWGYAAVPTQIKQACLLLAVRLYKRKDAPFGVLENPVTGSSELPMITPDIKHLIQKYKRYGRPI